MGGLFGVVSASDCVESLFYGTDYHCHLGTRRGGLAVLGPDGAYSRFIHDISNAQFKSKFESDIGKMRGRSGIGVISDHEDQPLIVGSHLGVYALATVGALRNAAKLAATAFSGQKNRAGGEQVAGSGQIPLAWSRRTLAPIHQDAGYGYRHS